MKKTHIVLLSLIIIQGIVIFLLPSRNAVFGNRKISIIKNVSSKDIASVTISKPGTNEKVTLVKNGKNWEIKEAFNFPADQSKIYEILAVLPNLKSASLVSENKAMFTNYELGSKPAWRLVLSDANNRALVDIFVGKSIVRGTFIRKAKENRIYRISGSLGSNLFSTPREFFEDSNLKLPPSSERKEISIKGSGYSYRLKKVSDAGTTVGSDGQVKMTEEKWTLGDTLAEGLTEDASKISEIVESLKSVSFENVIGTTLGSAMGLEEPTLLLSIKGLSKTTGKEMILSVKVGNQTGDKDSLARYVMVSNSKFIYTVDENTVKKWMTPYSSLIKKAPEKNPDELGDKIKKMKLPSSSLDLKVPMPDAKNAKESVIYPSAPSSKNSTVVKPDSK
ncbi:MAG: DUF4340 domain-containing protein [Deltaproteobacteria bacterium]|nr:DUF4340 domain-containing protein [Deltaproteobacteria bacterium]